MTDIIANSDTIITFTTLNGKNLYGIYKPESSTVSDLINSFFNNYDCKGYTEKLALYSDDLESYLSQSNNLVKDVLKTPIVLKVKIKNDNTFNTSNTSNVSILDENGVKQIDDLMKRIKNLDKTQVMELFVKSLTGKTMTFVVPTSNFTVMEMKLLIAHKENIPVGEQRLIFAGKQLEDAKMIREGYHIYHESTLFLVLRLRGGMYDETSGRSGNFEPLKSCVFLIEAVDHNSDDSDESDD